MGRTPAVGMLCGIGRALGGMMPPGGGAPNVAACIRMPSGGGGRACIGGCIGGCIPGCIGG